MANQDRNRNNQFQQNDQDWDRDRNRYGNDYDAYSNNPGGYGQANYNQDFDRDYNRSGNRNYGNKYNNPYGSSSDFNSGNYDDRNQRYSNSNQQYGGGYNQDRWNDDYANNPGMSQRYGGSNWQGSSQPNYRQDYNDHNNRGFGGNYNDDDRRYRDRSNRQSQQNRDWWERTSDEIASWFGDESAERRRRQDRAAGPHRGKGPRGYKRSDDRIKDDINDRLSDDPYIDASDIDVKVTNGEVVLSGSVDSKEAKRRAEDLAESVSGVSNVENHIRVTRTVSTVGNPTVGNTTNREGIRDNENDTDLNEKKKSTWI